VCLAVPGRIEATSEAEGLRMARVDFGGVRKEICLETLPEARPGDWILVHAGFALQVLDREAAGEISRLFREAGAAGSAGAAGAAAAGAGGSPA
jgi:hydrogenase expression/formation protein HypC